jgi:hypothetical protein
MLNELSSSFLDLPRQLDCSDRPFRLTLPECLRLRLHPIVWDFFLTLIFLLFTQPSEWAFNCINDIFKFLGGFAFSQEENGAVNQADLIRVYNTEVNKPTGV